MLQRIYVKDFILIEELEAEFVSGLIAITGETGSGKSILVEAINLLSGKRADSSTVRQGAAKAVIEGEFDCLHPSLIEQLQEADLLEPISLDSSADDSLCCLVRREISSVGRSRIFINDTPVSLSFLQEVSPFLLDVHSQHHNLLLRESRFQLEILDSMLPNGHSLEEYLEQYRLLQRLKSDYETLLDASRKEQEMYEFNCFRLKEINALDLEGLDPNTLEEKEQELRHSREIQESLKQILFWMEQSEESANTLLYRASKELTHTSSFKTDLVPYAERVESVQIELQDICSDLQQQLSESSSDPTLLETVTQKLNALNSLYYKLGVASWEQLLEVKSQLEQSTEHIVQHQEQLQELKKELSVRQQKLEEAAKLLSQERKQAAKEMERTVTALLKQLELPHARFAISLEETAQPQPSGMDRITFLFSANPELPPAPMTDVASGGEISRLMLAIKSLVRESAHLPTMVFDEIDTGISGIVAGRMGQIMRKMSSFRQMLVITHLPQIAAKASQHFLIYKNQGTTTQSHLTELDPEQRIAEIARLQSGANASSPVALAAAKELLQQI